MCQTLDKKTLGIRIDEPRWNLSWAIVYFVVLGWTTKCDENHWSLKLNHHLKELVLRLVIREIYHIRISATLATRYSRIVRGRTIFERLHEVTMKHFVNSLSFSK